MNFDGDGGLHRGRREARENVERNDRLARRERVEASAVRDRLEKGAPHQRVDLGRIVAMAACDAVAARSLEKTLGGLRQMAQGGLHKRKVADSGGSISSDAQTERDHFGTGRVGDAMEVLSAEDMAHLARQRWRSRFF
jgi:hypothetical protein